MTNTNTFTPPHPLNTAVLFLVFNRPDTTARVLEAIRQAKPSRLYVAADGPRKGHEGEAERVAKVRDIATTVDWPCELRTLFREKNLGCKHAVSGAITWFFEQEEHGIVLEDDCLPHPDFFRFCDTLLHYYLDDERVAVITGNNFQNGQKHGEASYYFSKYNHCWGWATWRRAWKHYDGDLSFWSEWAISREYRRKMNDRVERHYWERVVKQCAAHKVDSWAYPWTLSTIYVGGLTATPQVNLVSNIGFGPNATHTSTENDPLGNLPTYNLGSLVHPAVVMRSTEADIFDFNNTFGGKYYRLSYFIIRLLKKLASYVYFKSDKGDAGD